MPDDYARLLRPTPAALDTSGLPQAKAIAGRRQFRAQWVRFPLSWLVALRETKSGYVWQLATEILFAEFRRQHTAGEIVLSEATTGLPHSSSRGQYRRLVGLGLIEVEQDGRRAQRVTLVNVEMVASTNPMVASDQPNDR